jgi:hypothetical protein
LFYFLTRNTTLLS